MTDDTSTDVSNDTPSHTPAGKFAPGNKLGRGNPHAKRIAELKSAVLEAVDADDLKRVIRKLVELACDGDVAAAKTLMDRLFGKEVIAHIETATGTSVVALMLPPNGRESPVFHSTDDD